MITGAILLIGMFAISPAFASFTDSILIQVSGEFKKVYYNEKNITSVSFNANSASVIFETGSNATLEIKAPKVYKEGPGLFLLKNGEEIDPEIETSDDCFYYITIETKIPEIVEIAFTYWPEYPETVENCETFGPIAPLKQTALGIPFNEIQCKQNLVLVQKYDDSPACVTESTKQKLVERGWTTTNDVHDTAGSSNGHWKLKTEVFVATSLKEITPIDTVKTGGQYSATAILTKPLGMSDQHPELGYVMYVQVLDPNGDRIAGSWHDGTIRTDQTMSGGAYWSPKDVGNYTIEVFAWQSFTGTPHADISRHTVEVTE